MNKTTAILGTLGALIIGFFIGKATISEQPSDHNSGGSAVKAAAPDASIERYKVPVGNAAVTGPAGAKVTIVEFSDYQCPFCSRVEPTVDQIKRTYAKDVRLAFKNNPLPFHPNALPAARAALASREQGDDKFWAFHKKLFENQTQLDAQHFEQFAQEVGLNVEKFKADLSSNQAKYDARIQAEQAEAAKFGARGTPSFFINGRPISGAQPFENFQKIIDDEIGNADKALRAGAKPDQLYATLIQNGKEQSSGPEPNKPPPFQLPDPKIVYKVPVGNAPQRGPATAKVTIVEYSDFQCPFCSRVVPTLKKLEETYPNDVRIAFKHNPLSFHDKAHLAAEAAAAAEEQGKFWEMHDKLFENQKGLERADLEKYASEIGLDMTKFKSALDTGRMKARVDEQLAEGGKFGARGTPSFFINGKPFRGAQPFENFKKVVDSEIEFANAKLNTGVAPAALYVELTKNGMEKAAEPPPRPNAPAAEAQDNVVYKALIEDAPMKGAKDAKVTIVTWSDFQCPFCGRVEPTLAKVMETYPKDVRIAFKQLPLPFHDKAHLAAEAALAAKEQGKFWEMHDKMFENQRALDRADLEKYAAELGLNMVKFKAALDTGKWKEKVDAEKAEGAKIGANGTPAFFINGKSLSGAQPFESFKAKIDAAIADADALMHKKRIPARAIYDELMKDAKDAAAPPPAAAAGGGEGDDKTVYKVDPGQGPSWGSANAPVTIVEFSDFQCPFCSRVVPTVKQIKDTYAGKVRIVWRNYPLPFHPKAPLAAEAAMAAHAQGKFWDMHDKMFENQHNLERTDLEKYASEIGLDLSRFKADLDSGRYKGDVQADVQYANSLPGGGMGTPTFFINGRKIAGAYPFEKFDEMIKTALAEKRH
jgi:protein-disulfide isomerase